MAILFIRATDMTMIEQLKRLEATILEVRKHYHITATELVNLKNKTKSDIQTATQTLKAQLDNAQAEKNRLQRQLQNKIDVYDKIEQELTELKQDHAIMSNQFNELKQQLQYLQAHNEELNQKNLIAAEHTKQALQRLQQIDQAN